MPPRDLLRAEDEETRSARARVNTLLRDKWRLDELLGVGGMAAVYAATHRQGKRVAIKILHAPLAHNAEITQRFVDEGYIANHVEHPGIVSILDDDVAEDGAAFLVMDLLEGEALDELLGRRGRLDPLELLSLIDELLDVLAAAHAEGIIHRDIKPGNVFVTRDMRVKLLDFGVAQQSTPWRRSHVTPCGSAIGTPAFMAPEQARGRADEFDARTDLWAVGATMFTALSGRHVHEGMTYNEQMLAAMTQPACSLGFLEPNLPKVLVEFVDRALAYDKDMRWPDAETMQAALREVHAVLIEQGAHPRSVSDPEVSLEDSTAGAASHAPMTLPIAPRSAQSRRREAKTLVAEGSHPRSAWWLAVAITLVGMSGLAWIRWQHRQPASRSTADVAAAPGAGMAPSAAHAETAPDAQEPTCPVASARTDPPPTGPSRTKGVRRRGPRPADGDKSSPLPNPDALNRGLESLTAPVDPLERRR